jgi:hypothetical protein
MRKKAETMLLSSNLICYLLKKQDLLKSTWRNASRKTIKNAKERKQMPNDASKRKRSRAVEDKSNK